MLKQFSYQILGILAQLIYSFLKFFIPFLPRSILFPLQNSIAKLYFCFAKKDQKILFKNLEHISLTLPSVWEKKHFCQQVFSSQIKIGTETFSYLLSPKHHPIVFEGLDEYRDHVQNVLTLHNSSKGIIFVGSHLGSWELCAKVTRLALRPKRLTVLGKPPKIKNF